MVKVDRHDYVWVTDKGSDMVIKFTPAGRVAMVFGRKQEASDEETGPLKHSKPPLAAEPGLRTDGQDVASNLYALGTETYPLITKSSPGCLHCDRPHPLKALRPRSRDQSRPRPRLTARVIPEGVRNHDLTAGAVGGVISG